MMERYELRAAVECLLFVADEPLTLKRISSVVEAAPALVEEIIDDLQRRYQSEDVGLQIIEIAGGYRLCTKALYARYVEKLLNPPASVGLSKAALETLAIIAYRQPITRLEIEAIRGVKVERALSTLLERNLITEVGRKEGMGRPILYGTTSDFLAYFGLKDLKELPSEDEFKFDSVE